jgi:TonB family protein
LIARAVALACLAFGMRLRAQAVRLRNVSGTGGVVSVGSVNDTVWLSIRPTNGDLFTIRADTATMAGWADSPALFTDQAIVFVPLPPDSSAYLVRGVHGTQRDSIHLSADSARAVFAAMRGATPSFTPSDHAFLRFQVQRGATPIPGTRVPEYPEWLRSNSMGGLAWARFIVDSAGRVDTHSITIVSSTHPRISQAIETGLKDTRFRPAQIDGRNVAEVVDIGFRFRLPAIIDIELMDGP